MWWFVFGCVTLLHFQNAKAQGVYEFPGRSSGNRRSYAVYPGDPAYDQVYRSNIADGRVYPSSIRGEVDPSYNANGGVSVSNGEVSQSGVAADGVYYRGFNKAQVHPNNNIRRILYHTNGAVYPNNNIRRILYPTNSAVYPNTISSGRWSIYVPGGTYPSNVASGVAQPDYFVSGVTYSANSGIRVVNSNVATGTTFPNSGTAVAPNHINADRRVAYPNNIPGLVSLNAVTLGSPTPNTDVTSVTNLNSSGTRIFTPPSPQQQKILLDVYYETNCPDSKRFITDQLTPAYRDFKDILEVRLVPFGKAQAFYDEKTKTYYFECQHGPAECYGNTVQGCAMSLYPDVETHINFIDCMESYPRPSDNGQKCARRLSLDWNSISKCADSEEGKRILFRNGELTKSQQPPVTFVPWIKINGVHVNEIQWRSLRDLKTTVCEAHKAPHPKC